MADRVTSTSGVGPVAIQRLPWGGGSIHRQADGGASRATAVPRTVDTALAAAGRPLARNTRRHFERRFGHDFAAVRIHTDGRAADAAASINARAFTAGSHIVFGRGEYAPESPSGQKLMAHELTHVLQQRHGVVQRACKTQSGEVEHTVVQDDTLSEIAETYGTTTQAIKDRNGLEGDLIRLGQVLCIPASKEKKPPKKDAPKKDAPKKDAPKKTKPGNSPKKPKEVEYIVKKNDSLGKIAKLHDTTVEAIQKRNKLEGTTIHPDQKLIVPLGPNAKITQGSGSAAGTCSIKVPKDVDTQRLAGVIFAEADAKRTSNDERRAIAWSFLNAVEHTVKVCNGQFCTSLKDAQRKFLCKKDKRDLGKTVLDAIKIGSVAHGNSRWNLVMSSDKLKSSQKLCKLNPGEQTAIERSIKAAKTAKAGKKKVAFIRFNQAKNKPPSTRMVLAKAIGAHSFYSFKAKEKEGRCFI